MKRKDIIDLIEENKIWLKQLDTLSLRAYTPMGKDEEALQFLESARKEYEIWLDKDI